MAHCCVILGALLAVATPGIAQEIEGLVARLGSDDPFTRVDAAHALAEQGKSASSAVPQLIALFPDHRIGIRGAAALYVGPRQYISVSGEASKAVWQIGESAIPHLVDSLTATDKDTREVSARTLALFSEKAVEAVPSLIKQCDDVDADVRRECVSALAAIKHRSPAALSKVLAMLTDEPDEGVRYEVVQAIVVLGGQDSRVVTALETALNDKSAQVRGLSARELGDCLAHADIAVPALVKALSDDGMQWEALAPDFLNQVPVRRDVVNSLVKLLMHAPSEKSTVAEAMSELKPPEVRANAALVLVKAGMLTPQAADVIRSILEDDNGGIEDALAAMAEMGPSARSMVRLARRFTTHDAGFIRCDAIRTLGHIGGPQAVETLILLMSHKDINRRTYAAEALGSIGAEASESMPLLQSALLDRSDPGSFLLRLNAARALGKMGPAVRAATPNLLRVADDPNEDTDIRAEAVLSLGSISPSDERVLKSLQGILEIGNSTDDELRRAAAIALGNARGNAALAIPQLVSLLDEPYGDDQMRAAAARSLAQIGKKSEAVVAALMRALNEKPDVLNEELRREAALALGKLRATSAINLLQRVSEASDEDESVRRAATEAASSMATHN